MDLPTNLCRNLRRGGGQNPQDLVKSFIFFNESTQFSTKKIMYFLKNTFPKKWFWYFPVVWVSMEYIRSMGTLGFPWVSLANTQLDFLTLAQNVEITGIYGISFWIVLINVLMFNWLVRPFRENFLWILFFFMFPWITGWFLMPELQNDNEFLEVAVIQPNIHLYQKWKPGATKENITTLLNISNPALKQNVDLIIWPESSISTYLLQGNDSYLKWIQRELKDTKLIAGIPYFSCCRVPDQADHFPLVRFVSSVLALRDR